MIAFLSRLFSQRLLLFMDEKSAIGLFIAYIVLNLQEVLIAEQGKEHDSK
ncbi:hypothetical protein M3936_13805 [Sutcliffiella horikoshii]|nr:hypothetical protein [Sutcliffiella horikoshii]MCM3618660.1 hypothetical protein [Sutcliffiella horikoshii]